MQRKGKLQLFPDNNSNIISNPNPKIAISKPLGRRLLPDLQMQTFASNFLAPWLRFQKQTLGNRGAYRIPRT